MGKGARGGACGRVKAEKDSSGIGPATAQDFASFSAHHGGQPRHHSGYRTKKILAGHKLATLKASQTRQKSFAIRDAVERFSANAEKDDDN